MIFHNYIFIKLEEVEAVLKEEEDARFKRQQSLEDEVIVYRFICHFFRHEFILHMMFYFFFFPVNITSNFNTTKKGKENHQNLEEENQFQWYSGFWYSLSGKFWETIIEVDIFNQMPLNPFTQPAIQNNQSFVQEKIIVKVEFDLFEGLFVFSLLHGLSLVILSKAFINHILLFIFFRKTWQLRW